MTFDPDTVNALGKLLSSEPAKELIGPAAHEVGIFLGDVANMFRFYATENLEKIGSKWARNREQEKHGKGQVLDAEEFRRVMPLLTAASMVADDELQERWAALLESAASAEPNYLPSFGQTLSQLSADEARYLDRVWEHVNPPAESVYVSQYPLGEGPVEEVALIRIYDPTINTGVSHLEHELYKDRLNAAQTRNYQGLRQAKLVIDDLVRLGILSLVPFYEAKEENRTRELLSGIRNESKLLATMYALSPYGVCFIQAVSPKKQATST